MVMPFIIAAQSFIKPAFPNRIRRPCIPRALKHSGRRWSYHSKSTAICPAGSEPSLCRTLPPIYWSYLPNLVLYADALALQHALVRHKIDCKSQGTPLDVLILLQHKPVYTVGRRAKDSSWLAQETSRLASVNPEAHLVSTLRGGETTFHGPGQLVGYPILDIGLMGMTTRRYVDLLLKALSDVLVHPVLPIPIETLDPCSDPSLPVGTFVGNVSQKIASIGIQVRRRVTSHGFALNVERVCETGFQDIVACGLSNTRLVSIESTLSELARHTMIEPASVSVTEMVQPTIEVFGKIFGREMRELTDAEAASDSTTVRLLQELKLGTRAID